MREIMLVPLPRASDKRLISFLIFQIPIPLSRLPVVADVCDIMKSNLDRFFFLLLGRESLEYVVEALGSVDS